MMLRMNWQRFSDVTATLQMRGFEHGASGWHGLMCGVLAVNATSSYTVWLHELVENNNPTHAFGIETERELRHAFEVVREQLFDPEMGFRLLLPEDHAPFKQRLQAVAQWCDGFMFGVALSAVDTNVKFSLDSQEILRDVAEIARLGVSQVQDEADELAYVEIVEYLRVGVLIIAEEFRADRAS